MNALPIGWQQKAREQKKQYERFLKRSDRNKALALLPELHEAAVEAEDCLSCAACCKNHSPRFKTPDIRRIARHLGIKESVLIDRYLYLDDEGDYVVKTKPCPFLGADNHCQIYEVRPSDCSRFPYTDEDVLLKRPAITLMNVQFCPIVYRVMNGLLEKLPH